MSKILPIQETLRRALPTVHGCKDYREQEALLLKVDQVLRTSGVEQDFLRQSQEIFEEASARAVGAGKKAKAGARAMQRHMQSSVRALRCTILGRLTGQSYRELSKSLAMSPLYRWFARLPDFEVIRVPGKSTLQGYAHWLPMERMEKVLDGLTAAVIDPQKAACLGLEQELDMACAWVDATCLKACIHFPTDWVLLRDAVRTIMKNILTIRRHGLCHRMAPPEVFLGQINALSMQMAAAGRRGRAGGKKQRKATLRLMKKLSGVAEAHGRRYRKLLDENWQHSDLSTRAQAEVILRRLDNVLGQLPEARRQAHERIIGGRKVPNNEKILSLYEHDVHVIVRGKAGADVEFGNSLFLAENVDGFVIDHQLRCEAAPDDGRWLRERLAGIKAKSGSREGSLTLCADRGFDSAATSRALEREQVANAVCPRNPQELACRRAEESGFAGLLRRRGATEARIAILKNLFLDGVPRSKGFAHRQMQVAWAVLTHNLWVIARLSLAARAKEKLLAA